MERSASTGALVGDLSKQWQWHEAFRDEMKNVYRSNYMDMVQGRELSVKNDFPSGYGGHIPSLRHNIMFRNTSFDRQKAIREFDNMRESKPSFKEQLEGKPCICKKPKPNSMEMPTYKTKPILRVAPPWAVCLPLNDVPTFRTGVPKNSPA